MMIYCCTYAEAVKSKLHPPRAPFGWWPHNLTENALGVWRQHIDDALAEADIGYTFDDYQAFFEDETPAPKRRRAANNDGDVDE